jgi:hypothetical protein
MPDCGPQFALLQMYYHSNTPAMTKEAFMSSMGLNALRVSILATPKILEFMSTIAAFSKQLVKTGAAAVEAGLDKAPDLGLDATENMMIMITYSWNFIKDDEAVRKTQAFCSYVINFILSISFCCFCSLYLHVIL